MPCVRPENPVFARYLYLLFICICESKILKRDKMQKLSLIILFLATNWGLLVSSAPLSIITLEDCQEIGNILPMNGTRLTGILRRALEIATNAPRQPKRPRREDYDSDARLLLRFLTRNARQEISSSSQSSQELPNASQVDVSFEEDICQPSTSFGHGRRTSLETMQKIVSLVNQGQSVKAIQGKYKWYRKQYLKEFRRCVEEGGSHSMKREKINNYTRQRVDELLAQNLPVKRYMIRAFGRRAAALNDAPWFKGSSSWIKDFRKKNRLSTRKVTKKISRPRIENQPQVEENILTFLNNYTRLSRFFRRRSIWNIDQSGIEYEQSNERTIARTGSRDVYLRVDSLGKTTHSFTAQPILTRDGRLIGPLGLCMQEPAGQFGDQVRPRIERLERIFRNVKIYASSSGKMSSALMSRWMRDVMAPTIQRQMWNGEDDSPSVEFQPETEDEESIPQVENVVRDACGTDSWINRLTDGITADNCEDEANFVATHACHRPYILLLADAWSGQSSNRIKVETRLHGARPLTIPPHTTDLLQPLDVGFFRQLKIFIRRITEEALVQNRIGEITSREGIINLMSIIYNQLQSPAYYDLWRYAWRHTDPLFTMDELSQNPPANVNSIQFDFDPSDSCHVENCTEEIVMRSSHDGSTYCLTHLLQRRSIVNINEDSGIIDVHFPKGIEDEVDDEDDEDIFLYPSMEMEKERTTSTTPQPFIDALLGDCGCSY